MTMRSFGSGGEPVTPQMTPEETYAYYMAMLKMHDGRAAKRVEAAIEDRLADLAGTVMDTWDKATAIPTRSPLERLNWYRQKGEDLWTEQQAKFPKDWATDWADWQRLRERALRGELGQEEQVMEQMLALGALGGSEPLQ